MRALSLSFVLVWSASLALSARAADCPQADISRAASDLQDARNALTVLPADKSAEAGSGEMETRLADFVRAYMRCQPESADVEGIEVDLARLGWASAAADGAPSTAPGRRLTFKAEYFGQGQIGITATFSIPSGVDVVSLTFRHGDEGWAETGWHSGPQPR